MHAGWSIMGGILVLSKQSRGDEPLPRGSRKFARLRLDLCLSEVGGWHSLGGMGEKFTRGGPPPLIVGWLAKATVTLRSHA